jgi:hypothetical protein
MPGDLSLWCYGLVDVAASFLDHMYPETAGPQIEILQRYLMRRSAQIRSEKVT